MLQNHSTEPDGSLEKEIAFLTGNKSKHEQIKESIESAIDLMVLAAYGIAAMLAVFVCIALHFAIKYW